MPFTMGTTEEETLCKDNIWNTVIHAKASIEVHKGVNIHIRGGFITFEKAIHSSLFSLSVKGKSNLYFATFPGMMMECKQGEKPAYSPEMVINLIFDTSENIGDMAWTTWKRTQYLYNYRFFLINMNVLDA